MEQRYFFSSTSVFACGGRLPMRFWATPSLGKPHQWPGIVLGRSVWLDLAQSGSVWLGLARSGSSMLVLLASSAFFACNNLEGEYKGEQAESRSGALWSPCHPLSYCLAAPVSARARSFLSIVSGLRSTAVGAVGRRCLPLRASDPLVGSRMSCADSLCALRDLHTLAAYGFIL